MKLTKLFLASVIALSMVAIVACDKEDSPSSDSQNETASSVSSSTSETSTHTHSYTKGICECGELQPPTVNVSGKTYIVSEMTNIYATTPTESQREACESFLVLSKTHILGMKYTFNADGTLVLTYPIEGPPVEVAYTYTQAGDFVYTYADGELSATISLSDNQESFLLIADYSMFAQDPEFEGYAGLSVKHVLTLEDNS